MTTLQNDFTPSRALASGWLHERSRRLVRRMAACWLPGVATSDLAGFDDHILRDIGIGRDQIPGIGTRAAAEIRLRHLPLW